MSVQSQLGLASLFCNVNQAVINVPIFENLLVEAKRKTHSKCLFVLLLKPKTIFIHAVSTVVCFKYSMRGGGLGRGGGRSCGDDLPQPAKE